MPTLSRPNEDQLMSVLSTATQSSQPRILAYKYITGYGQERGGVTANIFNNMNNSQEINYFDSVPWFLKLYLHTLKVSVLGNEQITQSGKYFEKKNLPMDGSMRPTPD